MCDVILQDDKISYGYDKLVKQITNYNLFLGATLALGIYGDKLMIKKFLGATLIHCYKLGRDLIMIILHVNCFVLDLTQPRLIMI